MNIEPPSNFEYKVPDSSTRISGNCPRPQLLPASAGHNRRTARTHTRRTFFIAALHDAFDFLHQHEWSSHELFALVEIQIESGNGLEQSICRPGGFRTAGRNSFSEPSHDGLPPLRTALCAVRSSLPFTFGPARIFMASRGGSQCRFLSSSGCWRISSWFVISPAFGLRDDFRRSSTSGGTPPPGGGSCRATIGFFTPIAGFLYWWRTVRNSTTSPPPPPPTIFGTESEFGFASGLGQIEAQQLVFAAEMEFALLPRNGTGPA